MRNAAATPAASLASARASSPGVGVLDDHAIGAVEQRGNRVDRGARDQLSPEVRADVVGDRRLHPGVGEQLGNARADLGRGAGGSEDRRPGSEWAHGPGSGRERGLGRCADDERDRTAKRRLHRVFVPDAGLQ